ncbi:hypothetical protein XENTR_v10000843 [Xenopus tropicalis]|nr:hypothetical protein XENTR_v10000843 [Xenopus tropicalis]
MGSPAPPGPESSSGPQGTADSEAESLELYDNEFDNNDLWSCQENALEQPKESRPDEDSLSHNDEGPQELQEGEESAACEAWPSQEDDGSHDGEEEGVIQVVPRKKRRRAILTTNAGMFMMLTRIQKQLVNVQRTLNILCQNQRQS